TRWATHGAPAVHNAHPHFSHGPGAGAADTKPGRIALVHNGIIENHEALRAELQAKGYEFLSQTDTEVISHLVDQLYDGDLFEAVKAATARLTGAYAIAVFCRDEPQRVVGARQGSPLILGVGGVDATERFLASDAMAQQATSWPSTRPANGASAPCQTVRAMSASSTNSAPCATSPCTAARWNWAPTATTCKRKYSSSRAPLATRSKAWWPSPQRC